MLPSPPEPINDRRRIYLVRHADVSYFDRGQPLDPRDVPLNALGRDQAEGLRGCLAESVFDRVVTSGLPRTLQTAEMIVGNRDIAIESIPDFSEIQPGNLRDIPPKSRERAICDVLKGDVGRQDRFLGGESFGELEDRVVPAFRRLLEDPGWTTLLLVAHGGVNRVILSHALGADLRSMGRLEQDSACLNVIDLHEGSAFLVRLVNYTEYAPTKSGMHLTAMERIHREMASKRPSGGE